nr:MULTISPECIES: stage II sporulation protein P [unclassified Faecalibacterium]
MLALTLWGRGIALTLAGTLVGPVPALRTAFALSPAGQADSAGSTADSMAASSAAEAVPDTSIEQYLVELTPDDQKPADAGTVIETSYGQGSGEKYIACDAGTIKNNTSVSSAEVAAEIQNPLPFNVELNSAQPQVLIMHTHATECYRPASGLWFAPGDGARTTDRANNMCAVGRVMADTLNAAGINTLHDESLNDYPSYTGSYSNSRAVVQQYLAQYPSIKVVLDVHRDAIENDAGARMAPVVEINGRKAAQVMLICGCDNGSTVSLPNWRQNLRFAAAWESAMEGMYPGFTRPVLFSYRFYNQDLTTGSLLIEIGTHGNNLNEALYAGQLAANALVSLFGGAG